MDKLEQMYYGVVAESLGDFYHNRDEHSSVDLMVEKTTKAIYDLNQFANVSAEEEEEIRDLYSKLAGEMAGVLDAAATFEAFIESVAHIVQRYSSEFRRQLETIRDYNLLMASKVEVPACAEYTPELQLQLLGIDAENIQEPILDLGCGEHGRLVHHLRELGYQAIGVDRTVIESSHLIKSDWLQMPVTNETWGTVISHMAFSNHFTHHHMRKDGQPEAYARMYMSILRSLKKGGSFYYAPGLPFIEELLPPEQYRVTRIQNEEQKEFYSTRIDKL